MARVFFDGFESGDVINFETIYQDGSGNCFATGSFGDFVGSYVMKTQWQAYARKSITAAASYYFAFKFKYESSNTCCLFSWLKATTLLGYITRDTTTGLLKAYVGTSLVATSTKYLNTTDIYLIELYVSIADSGGRIVVKVNGITEIDYTGDTQPGADTTMDKFGLGDNGNRIGGGAYYDDIIVDDAAWIGNTKIQAIVPTGAGTTTDWTPSTGSNYACVDEKPASDTDYVSTNTSNHVDTYAMGNMSGTVGLVKSVKAQCRTKYEGTPTPTKLKLVIRSGGTDYVGADHTVTTAYSFFYDLWNLDPADSAAWTDTKVNALEAGVKAIA